MLIGTDFTDVESEYRVGRRRADHRNANQPPRTTLVMRVGLAVAGAAIVAGAVASQDGEAATAAGTDRAAHIAAINEGPAWDPNVELLCEYLDGYGVAGQYEVCGPRDDPPHEWPF